MYGKGKTPKSSGEGKGYYGSPKETHSSSAGEYAGTNELGVGGGPGRCAMRIKPEMARSQFTGGAGGKLPKTGKPYTEE